MSADVVTLDEVTVSLGGQRVLTRANLSVRSGEFVAVVGQSGCGKSTMLRAIGGLAAVSEGTVTVAGEPVHTGHRQLAYVFQQPRLAPWRDVVANVLLGAELRSRHPRRTRRDRRQEAEQLIDLVGLSRVKRSMAGQLSGGEQQRVAIARALIVRPRALLMDEPFSALDVATKTQLRQLLLDIWEETGVAVVFVTHDLHEAVVLADRVVALAGPPSRIVHESVIDLPRPRRNAEAVADAVRVLAGAIGVPPEIPTQEGER